MVEQPFNHIGRVMPSEKITPATASDLADLFEALSDPTRVRIIALMIALTVGVGELVDRIGLTKSAQCGCIHHSALQV